MNIKCRNIFFLIFFGISTLFATLPEPPTVSPYIIKGFSATFSAGYTPFSHQLGFLHSYGQIHGFNQNGSVVSEIKSVDIIGLRSDGFMNFGYNRFEWGFFTLAIPPITYIPFGDSPMDRLRINFSVFQKGDEDKLFRNSAMSLFGGISKTNYFSGAATSQVYIGASLGTRTKTEANNTCELFLSPSLNFVRYIYDDLSPSCHGVLEVPPVSEIIGKSVEISVPFANRLIRKSSKSRRHFSLIYGITTAFIVVQDVPNKKDLDDISIILPGGLYFNNVTENWLDIPRFRASVFAQAGIHFGNKTGSEKRRERRNENLTFQQWNQLHAKGGGR
jgi:hypothetical protein